MVGKVVNVTIAKSKSTESLGYGFIEFTNLHQAKECVKTMQVYLMNLLIYFIGMSN